MNQGHEILWELRARRTHFMLSWGLGGFLISEGRSLVQRCPFWVTWDVARYMPHSLEKDNGSLGDWNLENARGLVSLCKFIVGAFWNTNMVSASPLQMRCPAAEADTLGVDNQPFKKQLRHSWEKMTQQETQNGLAHITKALNSRISSILLGVFLYQHIRSSVFACDWLGLYLLILWSLVSRGFITVYRRYWISYKYNLSYMKNIHAIFTYFFSNHLMPKPQVLSLRILVIDEYLGHFKCFDPLWAQ